MTEVTNTAIGAHHTATTEGTWDGPAAVAAMPNDAATLRYCHAWRNADGDPTAKGTYKFPHHRTDGGPAVMAGVRNALARLPQADIPEADRAGVEAHLRAHMADANPSDHHHDDEGPIMRMVRPRARLVEGRTDWYTITAKAGGAVVRIYDEIGYFGVSAGDLVNELDGTDGDLTVHINSPGGDVFDGLTIYNALVNRKSKVTCVVDGLAASAASFIAMAGDEVVMQPQAQMMIHDAMSMCGGNAADMVKMSQMLDRTSDSLAQIYAGKAGGDPAMWRDAMRAETWYTAEEAVTAGLADRVAKRAKPDEDAPGMDMAAVAAAWDLSVFRYPDRSSAPAPAMVARATTTGRPAPAQSAAPPAWDPQLFTAAVREAATGMPAYSPDLFKAAVGEVANTMPAPPAPAPKPEPKPDPYDGTVVTRALRDAVKGK